MESNPSKTVSFADIKKTPSYIGGDCQCSDARRTASFCPDGEEEKEKDQKDKDRKDIDKDLTKIGFGKIFEEEEEEEEETLRHRVFGSREEPMKKSTSSMTLSCCSESWRVVSFEKLPPWLKDNDFLHTWHRPPLLTAVNCLKSIFRLHSETLNIWTHLIGAVSFFIIAVVFFLSSTSGHFGWDEKIVFFLFFLSAIACMSLSWLFHTMSCHSDSVSLIFVKLDYIGIAILIVGSFVPWVYFGFYCSFVAKCCYLGSIAILGVAVIIISSYDTFSTPKYRPLRAAVFSSLAFLGIVPATHFSLSNGIIHSFTVGCMNWLVLMGLIFILGALLYTYRIPERFFPGQCDLVFHSHQIFHVCVVVACYVEYHGIRKLAEYNKTRGDCLY